MQTESTKSRTGELYLEYPEGLSMTVLFSVFYLPRNDFKVHVAFVHESVGRFCRHVGCSGEEKLATGRKTRSPCQLSVTSRHHAFSTTATPSDLRCEQGWV